MHSKKIVLIAASFIASGLSLNLLAATASSTFQVTATVVKSCALTTTPIAFGNYDPTSATAVAAQGSVSARCTKGSVVSVALDQGANPGAGSTATVPARQMKSSPLGDPLPYHIYTANAGTTEWGNAVAQEPATQTSTSVTTALVFPTFGSLPAGQDVPSGNYQDTVTATLTF